MAGFIAGLPVPGGGTPMEGGLEAPGGAAIMAGSPGIIEGDCWPGGPIDWPGKPAGCMGALGMTPLAWTATLGG